MALCPDLSADCLKQSAVLLSETVVEALASLPSCCSQLWIALSGGRDSVTLLHSVVHAYRELQQRFPQRTLPSLQALHVNHQLQAAAQQFEHLCRASCEALKVKLHVAYVDIDEQAKGGLEALARDARYTVFEQQLQKHDVLWMAHHADDQAETVLQRAMRGSGVAGMAGMPSQRPLGAGWLMRPLLIHPRHLLEMYACYHQLQWCDDPSNASLDYDRNYLRHEIVPRLAARWPQAITMLGQVATHARDTEILLNAMADRQLEQWPQSPQQLPIDALNDMDAREAQLIIRRALAVQDIPLPPRARLATALEQLAAGKGHIMWPGGELHLWQGILYLARGHNVSTTPAVLAQQWDILPVEAFEVAPLRFVERQGGERLRINGHRRTLKAIFQAEHIPPWQRNEFCIVWCEDTPVALVSEQRAIVADGWYAKKNVGCGRG